LNQQAVLADAGGGKNAAKASFRDDIIRFSSLLSKGLQRISLVNILDILSLKKNGYGPLRDDKDWRIRCIRLSMFTPHLLPLGNFLGDLFGDDWEPA